MMRQNWWIVFECHCSRLDPFETKYLCWHVAVWYTLGNMFIPFLAES